MKFLTTVFFIFLFATLIQGQDMIVTTKGDTIQCRVQKIEDEYVHITVQFQDELRNTLVATRDIATLLQGGGTVMFPQATASNPSYTTSFWRLYGAGGLGRRTAKIDPDYSSDLQEYIEDLLTGPSLQMGLHYYLSDHLGIGIDASAFKAANKISSLDVSDDILIIYFGPSVSSSYLPRNQSLNLFASTSLGFLDYHNESRAGYPLTISSSTLGLLLNVQLTTSFIPAADFLLNLSYLQGMLSDVTVSSGGVTETFDLDEDAYESLNRLDISIGLSFEN